MNYRSEAIDLIMASLAKAQGSYKVLVPNEDAPGGKFANLQAILDSVRESLSNNGLAFFQYIELQDEGSGAALLKTILGHSSGQWISSCARVVAGKTDRATGTTYEFFKRQHAYMLLGVAPSVNDPYIRDDNGAQQAEEVLLKEMRKPESERKFEHQEVINKDQYTDILYELEGYENIARDIMEVYNIASLADLPKSEYHPALTKIRRIKKTHEDYMARK